MTRQGRTKWTLLRGFALGLTALAITACGSSGPAKPRLTGAPPEQFAAALALKDTGNCADAMPTFERLAQRGRGWELAQVHYADCLLEAGQVDDALKWLTLAAESNEPRAQARLALAYLEGTGVTTDPVQAAKWYVLATRETLEGLVADSDLPPDFRARLDAGLTERAKADGAALAAAWIPTYQGVNAELVNQPPVREREAATPRAARPGQETWDQQNRRRRRW